MELKFYKCSRCGQIVRKIKDTKVPLICCGEPMKELLPKENEEGFNEKHIPVFTRDNNKIVVKVGEVTHPSTSEHYIEWVILTTNKGSYKKVLNPGDAPEAQFNLDDEEEVEAVYACCNLHSLWVKKVK